MSKHIYYTLLVGDKVTDIRWSIPFIDKELCKKSSQIFEAHGFWTSITKTVWSKKETSKVIHSTING